MMKMWRRAGAWTTLTMAGAVAVGCGDAAQAAVAQPAAALSARAATIDPPDFRTAAAKALPAVVRIDVVQTRSVQQPQQQQQRMPEFDFPFPFGREFQMPEMQPQPRAGTGSGVIIDASGLVMTNRHVVDGADRVKVRLSDGREYAADVVGADPATDIAVVRLDAEGETFPAAELGDADDVYVGDWVLALGSPMGLDFSVTAGIVSAKGRSIGILAGESEAPLESFIQTDAAINPGNSGGPLVDLHGRVIGINTAIQSPTGAYSGYGFAVPIDVARKVANDLVQHGEVRRPRLGVQIADATSADARAFELESVSGAVVKSVQAGTPAEHAGVRMGDVIVGLNGHAITSSSELMADLAEFQPGDRVKLDVVRYGEREQIEVTLGGFDNGTASRGGDDEEGAATRGLGFEVQALTPELAQRMNLSVTSGLAITDVAPLSAAALAGVRPGQVIERVNGQEVRSTEDLTRVMRDVEDGAVVSLVVRQGDASVILNFVMRR